MQLSIIVPTYNNLNYLKFFIDSVKLNSVHKHEIILHINDGSDGTLNFAKENNIKFTHSPNNIGLCSSMNQAYSLATSNYILYAHDDMFFCKNWDLYLTKEINNYNHNLYYLSGMNVSKKDGLINYDCGETPENFNKQKFYDFCLKDESPDLQGSHWAPHLIHRELWNKIGGFSEIFNPGDGSDPDLCMKLWKENVRIFKCLSNFKVYHFNSVTTRKSHIKLNNGTIIFLLKYGFNPRFFRKYYLKGDMSNIYSGPLQNPDLSLIYLKDLLVNKIKYLYHYLTYKLSGDEKKS